MTKKQQRAQIKLKLTFLNVLDPVTYGDNDNFSLQDLMNFKPVSITMGGLIVHETRDWIILGEFVGSTFRRPSLILKKNIIFRKDFNIFLKEGGWGKNVS